MQSESTRKGQGETLYCGGLSLVTPEAASWILTYSDILREEMPCKSLLILCTLGDSCLTEPQSYRAFSKKGGSWLDCARPVTHAACCDDLWLSGCQALKAVNPYKPLKVMSFLSRFVGDVAGLKPLGRGSLVIS